MYDVILIDLDNTVLDFDAAESRSFKKIIENAGMDYTDELFQKYQEINTSLWRDLEQNKVSKDKNEPNSQSCFSCCWFRYPFFTRY